MKLKKTAVLYILDDSSLMKKNDFWKGLRKSLYALKQYAFTSGAPTDIAFCNFDDKEKELNFVSTESFAFSKDSTGIFRTNTFASVENFLKKDCADYDKVTFVFLCGTSFENTAKIIRLYSIPEFAKVKSVFCCFEGVNSEFNHLQTENSKVMLVEEFCDWLKSSDFNSISYQRIAGQKKSEQAEKKSESEKDESLKKEIHVKPQIAEKKKKKKKGWIGFVIFAGIFITFINLFLIVTCVESCEDDYYDDSYYTWDYGDEDAGNHYKVNTGDGDRLTLREAPGTSSKELLMLVDGEVMSMLEYGEKWSKVDYHGITGYVSTEWIKEGGRYEIERPDMLFDYGMYINKDQGNGFGWPMIHHAAESGHIGAQWEMLKVIEEQNGSSSKEAIDYLNYITSNTNSYEERTAGEFNKKVSDEKIANAKLLRRKAARKLFDIYVDKDDFANAESALKTALANGAKEDADQYYKLVHICKDQQVAVSYLNKILKLGVDDAKVYYYLGTSFYAMNDYESAFKSWWEGVLLEDDWWPNRSSWYYDCVYRAALCYQNGYGVKTDYQYAQQLFQFLKDNDYDY